MKPATLYRCYGVEGELLYAGCSTKPFERFANHRSATPWWFEVAAIRMEHFEDRGIALNAERAAIKDEGPRYNVQILEPTPLEVLMRRREERAELRRQWREHNRRRTMYEVPGLRCTNCGWQGGWVKKGLTPVEVDCPECDTRALVAGPDRGAMHPDEPKEKAA